MNWRFWRREPAEPVWLAEFHLTNSVIVTVFTPDDYWQALTAYWPTERNRMTIKFNREHPTYGVTP